MRLYSNLYEAFKETQRNLKEMGIPKKLKSYQNIEGDIEVTELRETSFQIMTRDKSEEAYRLCFPDQSKQIEIMKEWVNSEIEERFSETPVNPGEAWLIRKKLWERLFSKENPDQFDYTYNERIRLSLQSIVRELKRDSNTRRAYLSIWSPDRDGELLDRLGRVPCSLGYDFQSRQGFLDCHYIMRSSDIYEHWINDMVLAFKTLDEVAKRAGFLPGFLSVTIFNLHAYKKDLDARGIF